jgi:hypothetical protein
MSSKYVSPPRPARITRQGVRGWAIREGFSAKQVAAAEFAALLTAQSALLDSIRREFPDVAEIDRDGGPAAVLRLNGEPTIVAPVMGYENFSSLKLRSFPWQVSSLGDHDPHLNNSAIVLDQPDRFLASLLATLRSRGYPLSRNRLRSDFWNSMLNLILNRLLAERTAPLQAAIEPVYQGHHSYPFPALRYGPSIDEVAACSNLVDKPVPVYSLACPHCQIQISELTASSKALEWLSVAGQPGSWIAVHPWHLKRSGPICRLQSEGYIKLMPSVHLAVPLASQRTCRLVHWDIDVKMPIESTITGEHRLLYDLNVSNAVTVSRIAKATLDNISIPSMALQCDVASVFHSVAGLRPHLAMIVRPSISCGREEISAPCLNLWWLNGEFSKLISLRDKYHALSFIYEYCNILLTGPLLFWLEGGIGLEPHMQNTIVVVKDNSPVRMVFRDLDSCILSPPKIKARLPSEASHLRPDTWQAMPNSEIGERRLMYSLHRGHIGPAASVLLQQFGLTPSQLQEAIDSAYSNFVSRYGFGKEVASMRHAAGVTKRVLTMRLARSMQMSFN